MSTGIGGRRGRRKAPGIIHLAARTILPDEPETSRGQNFFWDGRATSLEHQVLVPIADQQEMGLDHQAMIERLSAIAGYRPYFRDTFGSDVVTCDRVASALADYIRTRMSGNAPYDRGASINRLQGKHVMRDRAQSRSRLRPHAGREVRR